MILAAENEQCDVINNYMADIQQGEKIVYEANSSMVVGKLNIHKK